VSDWKYWAVIGLVPQAIGGEEKLLENLIKHVHLGKPWFLIINDLGEIFIVKQEVSNQDPKLSLSAQHHLVT
jgi:hypothetical protein